MGYVKAMSGTLSLNAAERARWVRASLGVTRVRERGRTSLHSVKRALVQPGSQAQSLPFRMSSTHEQLYKINPSMLSNAELADLLNEKQAELHAAREGDSLEGAHCERPEKPAVVRARGSGRSSSNCWVAAGLVTCTLLLLIYKSHFLSSELSHLLHLDEHHH